MKILEGPVRTKNYDLHLVMCNNMIVHQTSFGRPELLIQGAKASEEEVVAQIYMYFIYAWQGLHVCIYINHNL